MARHRLVGISVDTIKGQSEYLFGASPLLEPIICIINRTTDNKLQWKWQPLYSNTDVLTNSETIKL